MENRDKLHPAYIAPTDPESINVMSPALRQGDTKDDDAAAIDQYFEAAEHTPIEYGKLIAPVPAEIAAATRIITKSYTLHSPDGGNTPHPPVQVLPRDLGRSRLFVICTTVSTWQFGSELADVYGAPLMSGNGSTTGYDLSGHTGALWIYTPSTSVDLVVKIWAVTR